MSWWLGWALWACHPSLHGLLLIGWLTLLGSTLPGLFPWAYPAAIRSEGGEHGGPPDPEPEREFVSIERRVG